MIDIISINERVHKIYVEYKLPKLFHIDCEIRYVEHHKLKDLGISLYEYFEGPWYFITIWNSDNSVLTIKEKTFLHSREGHEYDFINPLNEKALNLLEEAAIKYHKIKYLEDRNELYK